MDINNWQEWSPIINDSSGIAYLGAELNITMMDKEESKNGSNYNPVIAEIEEPNYFRWRAHMLTEFIFTNDKILELEKTSTGTRLIHKEALSGLLSPIFSGQMKRSVHPMLRLMNKH